MEENNQNPNSGNDVVNPIPISEGATGAAENMTFLYSFLQDMSRTLQTIVSNPIMSGEATRRASQMWFSHQRETYERQIKYLKDVGRINDDIYRQFQKQGMVIAENSRKMQSYAFAIGTAGGAAFGLAKKIEELELSASRVGAYAPFSSLPGVNAREKLMGEVVESETMRINNQIAYGSPIATKSVSIREELFSLLSRRGLGSTKIGGISTALSALGVTQGINTERPYGELLQKYPELSAFGGMEFLNKLQQRTGKGEFGKIPYNQTLPIIMEMAQSMEMAGVPRQGAPALLSAQNLMRLSKNPNITPQIIMDMSKTLSRIVGNEQTAAVANKLFLGGNIDPANMLKMLEQDPTRLLAELRRGMRRFSREKFGVTSEELGNISRVGGEKGMLARQFFSGTFGFNRDEIQQFLRTDLKELDEGIDGFKDSLNDLNKVQEFTFKNLGKEVKTSAEMMQHPLDTVKGYIDKLILSATGGGSNSIKTTSWLVGMGSYITALLMMKNNPFKALAGYEAYKNLFGGNEPNTVQQGAPGGAGIDNLENMLLLNAVMNRKGGEGTTGTKGWKGGLKSGLKTATRIGGGIVAVENVYNAYEDVTKDTATTKSIGNQVLNTVAGGLLLSKHPYAMLAGGTMLGLQSIAPTVGKIGGKEDFTLIDMFESVFDSSYWIKNAAEKGLNEKIKKGEEKKKFDDVTSQLLNYNNETPFPYSDPNYWSKVTSEMNNLVSIKDNKMGSDIAMQSSQGDIGTLRVEIQDAQGRTTSQTWDPSVQEVLRISVGGVVAGGTRVL
jgi:hypothetical protein